MSVIRRRSTYAHERNITFSHSLHVVVCSSDSSLQMLFPDYFVYTNMENPLKVVPLIHSNLTPVKFSHSPFCLFLFSSYSSCPLCRVLHQISFTNITIIFYFYISAATPRRVQCVWPDAQFCPERHRQSSFLQ